MSHFIEDENVEEFRGGTLQLNNATLAGRGQMYTIETSPATIVPSSEAAGPSAGGGDVPASTAQPSESDDSAQKRVLPMYHMPFAFENARDYFCHRHGLVESAIDECNSTLIFPAQDGQVLGSWLLTEISLWDNEKERLVTLTDKALITVKYDFIALRKLHFRKVPLEDLDTIAIGDLVYPPSSLVPDRNMRGVRALWNRGRPLSFLKKWNPFDNEIPLNTFTSHPLFWHKDTPDTAKNLYDFEKFAESLISAVEMVSGGGEGGEAACRILHTPIVLPNYVGLGSLLHNKNSLGFFKVRGKFSF